MACGEFLLDEDRSQAWSASGLVWLIRCVMFPNGVKPRESIVSAGKKCLLFSSVSRVPALGRPPQAKTGGPEKPTSFDQFSDA